MKKNRFLLSVLPFLCAADTGGGSGGGEAPDAPQTLEEQLTSLRSELGTVRGDLAARDASISTLTQERDAAQSEVTRLTEQFNLATQAATEAQNKVTALTADVTARDTTINSLTSERDTARTNITRLETLCGVKGIDPKSAPAPAGSPEGFGRTAAVVANEIKSEKDPAKRAELMREFNALS